MYDEKLLANIVYRYDGNCISDDEIVELIYTLVHSGEVIEFPNGVFDFASTGGPSSLTTILVPLYLYGCGANVVNLAVPGRPAGAVDVLSQIDGYNLDSTDIDSAKRTHFYIHLAANDRFAPLDKALFDYRKKIGKVNVPNLAIASLLSKKVASGASIIGLDVRCASFGNFGQNWDDCINNSKKYNRIANMLGMQSTCFVSDANTPYQPYIGRGESLEAIFELLMGTTDHTLQEHNKYCRDIACTMLNKAGLDANIEKMNLKTCFEDNLIFQGSTFDSFLASVERVKSQTHYVIHAAEDGYITYNLETMRSYIVSQQNLAHTISKYPDPCGITLLCRSGDYIHAGTPILSLRYSCADSPSSLHGFYSIQKEMPQFDNRKEVI